ncbi:MAG TPA: helix-turn-helix domain-containing protein [Anaerolineales bacterium]
MFEQKRKSHYPLELKLEAMRLFYEEGKTRAQITAQLGIRDADRVKKWLRQYRLGGAAALASKPRGHGRWPKKENKDAYIARLEMENDLLKKFQAELRKGLLAKRNIGSSSDTGKATR